MANIDELFEDFGEDSGEEAPARGDRAPFQRKKPGVQKFKRRGVDLANVAKQAREVKRAKVSEAPAKPTKTSEALGKLARASDASKGAAKNERIATAIAQPKKSNTPAMEEEKKVEPV